MHSLNTCENFRQPGLLMIRTVQSSPGELRAVSTHRQCVSCCGRAFA